MSADNSTPRCGVRKTLTMMGNSLDEECVLPQGHPPEDKDGTGKANWHQGRLFTWTDDAG